MEKNHYDWRLFERGIAGYSEQRSIDVHDLRFLYLLFLYPEKFWKAASSYARSNKAWLPEKSVEKLQTAVHQTEEKEAFLENVFSLDLYRSGR